MKGAKAASSGPAIASHSSDVCGRSGKFRAQVDAGAQQPSTWLRCLTCALELVFFCWSMGVRLSEVSAGCGHSPVVPEGPAPAWCTGSLLQRTAAACKRGRCLNPATFLAVGDWAMVYYIVVASASCFCMLCFPKWWRQRRLWIPSALAIRIGTITLHLVQLLRLGPTKVFFLSTVVHSLQKSRSGLVFLGYWAALSLSVPLSVHLWASGIETTLAVCVSAIADIGTHGRVRLTIAQVISYTMVMYVVPMLFISLQHTGSTQQRQDCSPEANSQQQKQRETSLQMADPGQQVGPKDNHKQGSKASNVMTATEGDGQHTGCDSCSPSGSSCSSGAQIRRRTVPAAPAPVTIVATKELTSDSDYASASSSMEGNAQQHSQVPATHTGAKGVVSQGQPKATATYTSANSNNACLTAIHPDVSTAIAAMQRSLNQSWPKPLPSSAGMQAATVPATGSQSPPCAATSHAICECAPKPIRRATGTCLSYQAKTQVKAMSIKVYHHPGTYEQYATVLTASALNQVAHNLHAGQQGKGAWILQAACVRGCVQLFMWLVSPAAAYDTSGGTAGSISEGKGTASSSELTETVASSSSRTTSETDVPQPQRDQGIRLQAMKAANGVAASLQGLLADMLPSMSSLGPVDVQCFPACGCSLSNSPTCILQLAGGPSPHSSGSLTCLPHSSASLTCPASSSLAGDSTITQTWTSDAAAECGFETSTELELLWVEPAALDVSVLRQQQRQQSLAGDAADLSFEAWAPLAAQLSEHAKGDAACNAGHADGIRVRVRALSATVVRVLLIDATGQVVLEDMHEVTAGYNAIRLDTSNLKMPECMPLDFAALHLVLAPPLHPHPLKDATWDSSGSVSSNATLVYASTRVLLLPSSAATEACALWGEVVADFMETEVGCPATEESTNDSVTQPQPAHNEGIAELVDQQQPSQEGLLATAWAQHYQPILHDLAFLADCANASSSIACCGVTAAPRRVDSCIDLMGEADSSNIGYSSNNGGDRHGSSAVATAGVARSPGASALARETTEALISYFESLGMIGMVELLSHMQAASVKAAVDEPAGEPSIQVFQQRQQQQQPGPWVPHSNQAGADGFQVQLHALNNTAAVCGSSEVPPPKSKSARSSSSSDRLSGSTAACSVPTVPLSVDAHLCSTLADWSLGR